MVPLKSAGNEHVAKQLASLYSNEEDSDCVVVFCLKASSLQEALAPTTGEPLSKRQRLVDGSVSAHCGGRGDSISFVIGDPLPGHQLVLRFASERFGAQLKRWDTRKSRAANGAAEQAAPAPSASVDGRPLLRVHLTSEAEEPAARSAIRYAYTGDVAAGSIREALEVRRQALNLRIEGCAAACMEIVKAKLAEAARPNPPAPPSSSTIAAAAPDTTIVTTSSTQQQQEPQQQQQLEMPPVLELLSCEPLWPDPAADADFAGVLSAAKPQLVTHFGDALRTLNTPTLRAQLCALPACGVEALLESDDFGSDGEATVLLLLAVWMEANNRGGSGGSGGGGGAAADAATRERLCRQVRLVQLSRPYLASILPVLALDYETAGGGANGGSAAVATAPAAAAASSSSGAAVSAAGWFPIRGAEAAFIVSLATSMPPLREALAAAGRRVYDMSSPWYSQRRRRQCLPATGLVFHWRIPAAELVAALGELAPGGLCCTAGCFNGGVAAICAAGFEWWPSIEYRHGASDANLGLYSQMPEALQPPGSRLAAAPKPAVAVVAGVDADLSVHHWQGEALVDDGVYFSTTKDIWQVGGGRGANVLALRQRTQAQQSQAGMAARSGGGSSGGSRAVAAAALAGPLAAWDDYLRDGEMAGTLTLLPPPA